MKLNFHPKLVICTAFICYFHKSGTALEEGQQQGISLCVIQCVTTLITLTELCKRFPVFIKTLQYSRTFNTFHACISNIIRYECRRAKNVWKKL